MAALISPKTIDNNESWDVQREPGNERKYRTCQQRVPMFFPHMGQWRQLIRQSSTAADKYQGASDIRYWLPV